MTIAQLAKREAELLAELAQVREEIASRAGQVDPPPRKTRKTAK